LVPCRERFVKGHSEPRSTSFRSGSRSAFGRPLTSRSRHGGTRLWVEHSRARPHEERSSGRSRSLVAMTTAAGRAAPLQSNARIPLHQRDKLLAEMEP
jgi:hypothetical protein